MWDYIVELAAMPFRSIADWAVLAAALAGAAAIASRRPLRLLLVPALSAGLVHQFPLPPGCWFVLFVSLLAGGQHEPRPAPGPHKAYDPRPLGVWPPYWPRSSWLSLATLNESQLETQVAKQYPGPGRGILHQPGHSYDGPLYNTFNWGGYLIYNYREHPVCMDGRTIIHGAVQVVNNIKMGHGKENWQSDPELAAARLFILPRKEALTLLMRLDTQFTIVYEDDLAVVFVRR